MGILPNMAVISELQYQRIPDALRMVEETFRATLAPEFTEEGGEIFLGLLNEDAFRKRQSAGNKSYVAKANCSSRRGLISIPIQGSFSSFYRVKPKSRN